jgi:hypothetical protein
LERDRMREARHGGVDKPAAPPRISAQPPAGSPFLFRTLPIFPSPAAVGWGGWLRNLPHFSKGGPPTGAGGPASLCTASPPIGSGGRHQLGRVAPQAPQLGRVAPQAPRE